MSADSNVIGQELIVVDIVFGRAFDHRDIGFRPPFAGCLDHAVAAALIVVKTHRSEIGVTLLEGVAVIVIGINGIAFVLEHRPQTEGIAVGAALQTGKPAFAGNRGS